MRRGPRRYLKNKRPSNPPLLVTIYLHDSVYYNILYYYYIRYGRRIEKSSLRNVSMSPMVYTYFFHNLDI